MSDYTVYGLGASPPFVQGATSWEQWQASIADSPLPMQYRLAPISDLLTAAYFPYDPSVAAKQVLLSAALQTYCGQVPNCTVPPAPPAPKLLPWPQYRMDSANSGQSPFVGPASCLFQWQIPNDYGLPFYSMLLGADDVMFLGTNALNISSRSPAWQFPAPTYFRTSALGPNNGLLYIVAELEALNSSTGAAQGRWASPNDTGPFQLTIGPSGDVFVVVGERNSGSGGGIYCLNASLSSVAWSYDMYVEEAGALAVGPNNAVYLCCNPGDGLAHVMALDGSTGNLLWNNTLSFGNYVFECVNPCPNVIIGTDGNLYVGPLSNGGSSSVVVSISPSGIVLSVFELPGNQAFAALAPGAVGPDGTLYYLVNDYDSQSSLLSAILPTGAIVWQITVDSQVGAVVGPIVGADGTIYVPVDGGYLYAVDTAGSVLWRFAFPSARTIGLLLGGDGTLFLLTEDYLYAFGRTTGTACG